MVGTGLSLNGFVPYAGDIWTWTAIDPESKLIISYKIGDRTIEMCKEFMLDMQSRLAHRIQLTSDSHVSYKESVEVVFGDWVDYSQLTKVFQNNPDYDADKAISPRVQVSVQKHAVVGNPDFKHISTSHVERQNLTMRMSMRRFTRRTNGFSKKIQNHIHMCSLYFLYYNFCRSHMSLKGQTPAMKAGIFEWEYDIGWIVDLIDQRAPKPNRPTTYKKRS